MADARDTELRGPADRQFRDQAGHQRDIVSVCEHESCTISITERLEFVYCWHCMYLYIRWTQSCCIFDVFRSVLSVYEDLMYILLITIYCEWLLLYFTVRYLYILLLHSCPSPDMGRHSLRRLNGLSLLTNDRDSSWMEI